MRLAPEKAVAKASSWLAAHTSRRGFLARSAVVGSALATGGWEFLVKPQSAYASVCGPGSTCASGWTVFCATINNGVNSCPPGTVAAGWWKADGASLCGGKARYIVDCNAQCTRCSAPSSRRGICSSSCWNCRCTCGPSGQCDQRRVCCNGFRYGQCNQHIPLVGGVVCRLVSCIPPWTFTNCTTAVATDNRTVDHNSPRLPQAWTPIFARYVRLGERKSVLGATVNAEVAVPGGRVQRYSNGRMSSTTATGIKYTYGPITTRFLQLGAEQGVMGFPTADQVAVGAGMAAQFQRGRISYRPGRPAVETYLALRTRYAELGYETGVLGFPVSTAALSDGKGRVSLFENGRISWHPDLGAFSMALPISTRYGEVGAETGPLGYPLANETASPGLAAVPLQNGRISWSPETGAVETRDLIAAAYGRAGNETGVLGLPLAPEEPVLTTGRFQRFQTGRVSARGESAFFTRGPIAQRYVERGAELGTLGWPLTDEYLQSPGVRRNDFERGTITYDEATGETTVSI